MDLASRNRLVLDNIGFAAFYARKYSSAGIPFEDLRQEAVIAMIRAAEKHRPGQGMKFTSFAAWFIQNRLRELLRREYREAGHVSLHSHVSGGDHD